jgi:molybdopterin/thiamine biosynthesis adenylyltransferase
VSGTEPEHWYEREPNRLAWELDEFERHGLTATVSHDNGGRLVITTSVHFRGEPTEVSATYPHGYPHFPPTVVGEARLLDRHQDPVGLNYCLLEDPDNDWHPTRSAGQLIGKNLRALLKDTEAGAAAIREGEADMAEPVGAQFLYDDQVVILVTDPFLVYELNATGGAMTLKRGPARVRILAKAEGIGPADPALVQQYAAGGADVAGRWVALDRRPRPEDFPQSILEAIDAVDPSILGRLERQLGRKKGLPFAAALVGLTFIEQGPTRDEERRNWMFAEIEQKRGYQPGFRRLLLPSQALSQVERQRRIPELAGLDQAHVVVIGAGSLGAPVALELVKAGVGRLDLIDPDRYDVNNAVRHVLATERAGELKADATAVECRNLNPFVDAHGHDARLGNSAEAHRLLDGLLTTATLLIDTTGAEIVGRFAAERACAVGVPAIISGLTAASYGADVLLIRPDGPCIDCFTRAQEDNSMPSPPVGPRSAVTPIGCRHPAFAGAGFEVTELAAVTARFAVRATELTQYPPSDSNWIVLNFRGDPHYHEGGIDVHPECGRHG